jgi:hypothetical protein
MRLATYSILALVFSSTACLRSTAFHCDSNADCGSGGTCSVGFCAFADPACASGTRFADSAGSYANQCVGDQGPDGGVDSGLIDAATDGPIQAGCPSGYNTITGGQGAHRYQLVTTVNDWVSQRDVCAATSTSAYLAIPDDATEFAALNTLTTATQFWVGISDQATEGTFVTVKGGAPAFVMWASGQPDNNANGQGEDCVAVSKLSGDMSDERCGQTMLPAICECEP